jgi:hypothetical protein
MSEALSEDLIGWGMLVLGLAALSLIAYAGIHWE